VNYKLQLTSCLLTLRWIISIGPDRIGRVVARINARYRSLKKLRLLQYNFITAAHRNVTATTVFHPLVLVIFPFLKLIVELK
jgi:hypothetical protein